MHIKLLLFAVFSALSRSGKSAVLLGKATEKYLELSEEEKLCPVCGTPLKEIGEEFVRRELVFVPYTVNHPYCSNFKPPFLAARF